MPGKIALVPAAILLVVFSVAGCGGGGSLPPVATVSSVPQAPQHPVSTSLDYGAEIAAMGNWMASSAMLPDGTTLYSSTKIMPYFGNVAAIGMSKDPAQLSRVRGWMQWYVAHLNATDRWGLHNTMYDYSVTATGLQVSTGDADSLDSYAATFLSLARSAYESGDSVTQQYVLTIRDTLYSIADTVVALQQSDGLTIAKPDYPMEYLMDNSEVYRGLSDMTFLSNDAFADAARQNSYGAAAARVYEGVQSLWNSSTETYAPWKQGNSLGIAAWNSWYPDSTSQLFPILFGIITPSEPRAVQLYSRFNEQFPAWSSLTIPDEFPWALVADVASIMQDRTRANSYLSAVKQKYGSSNYAWPWYCAEAGWYMRANRTLQTGNQLAALN